MSANNARPGAYVLSLLLLLLAGCQTPDDPDQSPDAGDLALVVAFDTAYGTLLAFTDSGELSDQAVRFMEATAAYGVEGCSILTDPATTPDGKRLALITDLADERAEFDEAFADVLSADLDPRLVPAIEGAKSAARLFATYRAEPEFWTRPCGTVHAFADRWSMRRPVAMAERQ